MSKVFWDSIRDALKQGYEPNVMIDNLKGEMSLTMWKGNHRLGGIAIVSLQDLCEEFPVLKPGMTSKWDQIYKLLMEIKGDVKEGIKK